MDEKKRAPRMRLLPEKRDLFLEVLGQTGNRRAAAQAIGVDARLMDQRREYDPVLDRQWELALDQAHRRLSGATGPTDCIGAREFNVIRRGGDGRLQLVAAGAKRWNGRVEAQFFAALGICGNVAAACRAVGFTESCVWQRRRKWPDFARRLEEAMEDAEMAIEFRLATAASGISVRVDGSRISQQEDPASQLPTPGPSLPGRGEGGGASLPGTGEAEGGADKFDPDLALRFLKWRQQKREGTAKRRGRVPKPPSIEEVGETILKRVAAIKRHEDKARIEQGWSRDEEGRMIPPGWVRDAPPGDP